MGIRSSEMTFEREVSKTNFNQNYNIVNKVFKKKKNSDLQNVLTLNSTSKAIFSEF